MRTGKMADRIVPGEYCADSDIAYLRVFKDGSPRWYIDGCSADGRVSAVVWECSTFDDAVSRLYMFADENAPHLLAVYT